MPVDDRIDNALAEWRFYLRALPWWKRLAVKFWMTVT